DSHSGAFTSGSASIVAPSVTTTSARDTVVGFFGTSSSKTIRPPAVMTEEFDVRYAVRRSNLDAEGAAYVQATPGATGERTARTTDHPSSELGQLLALRVAASPPPPPPLPPRRHPRAGPYPHPHLSTAPRAA